MQGGGECCTTSFQAAQRSILQVRQVAAFQMKMLLQSLALNTHCHTTVSSPLNTLLQQIQGTNTTQIAQL